MYNSNHERENSNRIRGRRNPRHKQTSGSGCAGRRRSRAPDGRGASKAARIQNPPRPPARQGDLRPHGRGEESRSGIKMDKAHRGEARRERVHGNLLRRAENQRKVPKIRENPVERHKGGAGTSGGDEFPGGGHLGTRIRKDER